MKTCIRLDAIGRLLAISDGGFEWDVAVPYDPARYNAETIVNMVKLVARRGHVRWFNLWDGRAIQYKPARGQRTYTALEFASDLLNAKTGEQLILSFESRTDARAFVRDLQNLSVRPAARQPMAEERKRHRRRERLEAKMFAEASRIEYPKGSWSQGENDFGPYWVTLLNAGQHSASDLDKWMRANIRGRYFAGLWRERAYGWERESPKPQMAKMSLRYWRLTLNQWTRLLNSVDDRHLIVVNFCEKADFMAFDVEYGARRFRRLKMADSIQ